MLNRIKWAVIGLIGLAGLVGVGVAVWHYQSILRDLDRAVAARDAAYAERDRAVLAAGARAEEARLWQQQAEAASRAMVEMADARDRAEAEKERLNELFRKHDLGRLTQGRTGLLETRINRGTARTLGMFERETATSADPGPD